MEISAVLTMIFMLSFIWGGLIYFVLTAFKKEKDKKKL
jgi:hypothetical protein